jgi:hypothetical protein
MEPSFHGVTGPPDMSHQSRSLAWSIDGLIVMANMWWEPLTFTIERSGTWRVEMATAPPRRHGRSVTVAPVPWSSQKPDVSTTPPFDPVAVGAERRHGRRRAVHPAVEPWPVLRCRVDG